MLPSYYEALRPLPDEMRLPLYDAIFDYAFTGKTPDDLSPVLNGYFQLMRPNIDNSIRHYAASVENGKKGGRPPKKPNENPAKAQDEPGENREKEKEKECKKEKEICLAAAGGHTHHGEAESKKVKRFVPPTPEEVAEYVRERNSPVEPQAFIDFYEAKGWMVGKNKMKAWRAACRNAESWDRWKKQPPAPAEKNYDLLGALGTKL